ncbi:MAG: SprT family zinc-dependent metalloprotease [Elusimicrobiota bacterium]|nr:SprT family zinc-dependent metalloprotease [Elusimicrobiota bacterium]
MASILHRSRRLVYQVVATPRVKTVALRVHRDGTVEVRAPRSVKQAQVRRLVARRADWIVERQRYFLDLLRRNPGKELKNGESFPLFGRNHRLMIESRPGVETPFCRSEARRLRVFVDGQSKEVVWSAIRGWYSALTEKKVITALRTHAPALSVKPGRLRIVDQAQRWASCAKTGDIRCNWRLAMMPGPVLEYVVVHELCHLRTPNHSVNFWRLLKSVLPDYEKRREWLKRNGPGLALTMERRQTGVVASH